ncbi:MAG TPA: DUF6055 domain-containing protein, partial [Xylanibacter oryzae]|nr:DUF6055 domain-containing protein [Xylanibacter oryzae]
MNKYLVSLALVLLCGSAWAQTLSVKGKQIYIPKDLQTMDLQSDTSLWSYKRMDLTKDFVVFWQRGFGHDLNNPPKLKDNDMRVDLKNLETKLERFYNFYKDTLQFIKPGSNADKYRMMVMLNYSLDGTAYGGDYDQIIGAFWVAPNRIHDEKLNCVAHELGHSFQFQVAGDKKSEEWRLDPSIEAIQSNRGSGEDSLVSWGGGFYEMTSQWMLWQVNPDWVADEEYHWDAYSHITHKAFLHLDNIYHSPYILEYWGMKHGLPFIADMYRQGKSEEDVVMTYKRMNHLTQKQFCDEMFDANRHIVNFDYPRVWKETRKFACTLSSKLVDKGNGWYQIAEGNAPENYGFNAIPLVVTEKNNRVKLQFKGLAG